MQFNHIHIEPIGGVAGDMILAALIHLGADIGYINAYLQKSSHNELCVKIQHVVVTDIHALYLQSIPHADDVAFRTKAAVCRELNQFMLPEKSKIVAFRIFDELIAAESIAHAMDPDYVHLHEVGQLDAILDVVGIALAWENLGAPTVSCSPLPSGYGVVKTSHGLLNCPVPAVNNICKKNHLKLESVNIEGETITPTGAAVIAAFMQINAGEKPEINSNGVGVGVGSKRFTSRPNILRAYGFA